MKRGGRFAVALAVALAMPQGACAASPVDGPAEAPAGAEVIPLYGKKTPGSPSDEITTRMGGRETVLRNITYPTLTVIKPDPAKANGTAVIVVPGGGFMMLSMQNEGWRVAQALADRGVTAFVLKYRLNPTPRKDSDYLASLARLFSGASNVRDIRAPEAMQDAVAALKVVRGGASRWNIDPRRVGMIGFSAGAMAALGTVLDASTDSDPDTRAPDFFGYIYGPMKAVEVPADAPPMFAALAMDDPLFGKGDFSIASAWHAAKRPVELHVYQAGGHGFGLGKPGTTTMMMMDEFLAWMDMQGLLKAKARP